MSAKLIGAQAPYGAFELKRCYQKNMLTGTLISGGMPLMILAAFVLIAYIGSLGTIETIIPVETTGTVYEIPPPTIIDIRRPPTSVTVKTDIPSFGTINPVEDEQQIETAVLITNQQKAELIASDVYSEFGDEGIGDFDPNGIIVDMIPSHDVFVPRQHEPVLLSAPPPVYPDMARQAGIEGNVIMQVFVDVNGDVIKARVARDSGCNAGFEEAAMAAAMLRKYSPALQNNQPVGVWIGYTVKFRLH